jgi:hypothetical protein
MSEIALRPLSYLSPGGCLLVGPGKAAGIRVTGCVLRRFGDASVYRRDEEILHVHIAQ